MGKRLNSFIKLILLAFLIIICDVILSYFVEVVFALIFDGTDAYILTKNIFGIIAGRFILYTVVAGWAYLIAVILFHFYYKTTFLKNYFNYTILLFFLFYLIVNYRFYGVSLYLIVYFAVIFGLYFIFSRELFWQSKHVEAIGIFFVIFSLFFYFYWVAEEREFVVLIEHILAYIPLAWIGQKVYSKLFNVTFNSTT